MTKAFRVLSKVSITRMRLASQTCEPRGALYLFAERRCRYCAAVHTRHLLPWPCSRENEVPAGRENAEKESEREGRNDAYKLRSPVRRRVFTPFTSVVLPTPQRPPWLIYRCGTRELSLSFSLFLRYSPFLESIFRGFVREKGGTL